MPPKVKFSKEVIIEKAYEIMLEEGIDAIVARKVGKRLGATTAPIFSYYKTMDELKDDVISQCKHKFLRYVEGAVNYQPAFKEFGLRWIRFSKDFPNAYKAIFHNTVGPDLKDDLYKNELKDVMECLENEIMNSFGFKLEEAKTIIEQMMIYSNGISSFLIMNPNSISEERANELISDVFIGLVNNQKLRNGTFIPEMGKGMAMSIKNRPQKK